MRKGFRKTICIILLVSTLLILPAGAQFDIRDSASLSDIQYSSRLENVLMNKIEAMSRDDIQSVSTKISNIKVASDFIGKEYIIAECEPNGYLIYHIDSGVIVESSLHSPSPYNGASNNLFYAGPTQYFYKNQNGTYIHTITNSAYGVDNNGNLDTLISTSSLLNTALAGKRDENNLSYVNGRISYSNYMSQVALRQASSVQYISNRSYITNLRTEEQMGYTEIDSERGLCGYVATGILLFYWHKTSGFDLIDDCYLNANETGFVGPNSNNNYQTLSRYLFDQYNHLGINNANAGMLYNAIQDYMTYDVGKVFSGWSTIWPSANTIKTKINESKPVVLGSNFTSPYDGEEISHYVTIYGYNVDEYVVHFGWPKDRKSVV